MARAVLGALIASLIIKIFLFDFMIAEGSSMTPAIRPGTVLIVSRLVYGFRPPWSGSYLLRWSRPKPGEVVVFYTPMGQLAVKRCGLVREDGTFIAVGDNGVWSLDSRMYGPVDTDSIVGKVLGAKSTTSP
jgi:signal peptidase I